MCKGKLDILNLDSGFEKWQNDFLIRLMKKKKIENLIQRQSVKII